MVMDTFSQVRMTVLSLDSQHGESCMLTGQGGRKENTFCFVFLQACADATMGFICESSR